MNARAIAAACVLAASAFGAPASVLAAWQWSNVGPSVIQGPYGEASGRVSSLALSSDGDLYAATANGGIWRRSKNGWDPLTDGQPNLAFGVVAAAPSDPSILYAATGEARNCGDCHAGSGVMVGTERGAKWSLPRFTSTDSPSVEAQRSANTCDILDKPRGSAIVIDPAQPKHVVLGNTAGVFVSTDGAMTWTQTSCRAVSDIKPAGGIDALVMGDDVGIHTSTDAGRSWNDVTVAATELPAEQDVDNFYSVALAVAPGLPSTIYASVAHAGYGGGLGCLAALLVSENSGRDWHRITVDDYLSEKVSYGGGSQCGGLYDNTIAVDPLNPGKIFAGGIALFSIDRSAPNSNAKPEVQNLLGDKRYPNLHPDQQALLFTAPATPAGPATLYIANDGGVSKLQGGKLENINKGLRITQFNRGGSQQGDGDEVVAGTQDNGTIDITGLRSKHLDRDAEAAWCGILGADGGMTALTPGGVLFAEKQYGSILRVVTDRAACLAPGEQYAQAGWLNVAWPSASPDRTPFYAPFLVMRGKPSTMFGGFDDLYQGDDVAAGAKVWSPLSSGFYWTPYPPEQPDHILISALAVGDDAGRILYTGHTANGVVQYTFTGGGARKDWLIADPVGALRVGQRDDGKRGDVSDIAVAPGSPYHVYVTITSTAANYVLETRDISAVSPAFTDLGAPGPGGVNRLILVDGALVAAADDGVYRREGSAWQRFGSGLPAVPVVDLIPTEKGCLFALTHGRGAWLACP